MSTRPTTMAELLADPNWGANRDERHANYGRHVAMVRSAPDPSRYWLLPNDEIEVDALPIDEGIRALSALWVGSDRAGVAAAYPSMARAIDAVVGDVRSGEPGVEPMPDGLRDAVENLANRYRNSEAEQVIASRWSGLDHAIDRVTRFAKLDETGRSGS